MESENNLKRLRKYAEIKGIVEEIYTFCSENADLFIFVDDKRKESGSINISDMRAFFQKEEKARHFLEIYSVIRDVSFEDMKEPTEEEEEEEEEKGIDRDSWNYVKETVENKPITSLKDLIGYFGKEGLEDAKKILEQKEESDENYMTVDSFEAIINLKLITDDFKAHIIKHEELDDRAYKEYISRKSEEIIYEDFKKFLNTLNNGNILSDNNIYVIIEKLKSRK